MAQPTMDAVFYATPTENPIVKLDGVVMQNSLKCKKYGKSNAHQQKPPQNRLAGTKRGPTDSQEGKPNAPHG